MTRIYKTTRGGEPEIRAYIRRAKELWTYASQAFRDENHDACAILVIHTCISLADAVCIAYQGTRYAGTSHEEAVQFFYDLRIEGEEFKKACRHLGQIIGEKTASEYGGNNLSFKTADFIHKNGERFRNYVLDDLLKRYG